MYFLSSPTDGHLDCFQFFTITKNIAVDILLTCASLGTCERVSLGYKSRGGTARFTRYCHFQHH